jgi:hypothetical protein
MTNGTNPWVGLFDSFAVRPFSGGRGLRRVWHVPLAIVSDRNGLSRLGLSRRTAPTRTAPDQETVRAGPVLSTLVLRAGPGDNPYVPRRP